MLKVNNEFINLPEPPHIVQQAKTPDLLESAGDFSYQFNIPNTAEARKIIGLVEQTLDIDADLINENGETIFSGNLAVENVSDVISLSFSSGNTNWFAVLGEQLVSDIPLEYTDHLKSEIINVSGPPLPWDRTSGVVYPLFDRGRLRNWVINRIDLQDFLPMVFIHEVMTAIFQSNGLKIQGDLLNDGLYKTLICGSSGGIIGSVENLKKYNERYSISVGKTSQTINTVPQRVLFTEVTAPNYNGTASPWDASTSRYTAGVEMDTAFRVTLNFPSLVTYTVTLRKNGVVTDTATGTGLTLRNELLTGGANLNVGDYLEVWASISAGTVDIQATSKLEVTFVFFDNYYPQFFLGPTTQKEFVSSVFTMFNVIASYDKYTKTVTCSLFDKLSSNTPQDLSQYIHSYRTDYVEVLSDLSKDVIFKHQEGESEDVPEYNELNPVPFAGGKITPDRKVLTGDKVIETIFTATKDYFNEPLQASLMDLGATKFTTNDGEISIISVADDGAGIALFTTADDHNLKQLQYITISNTSNGDYEGLGLIGGVPAPNQFKISHLAFTSTATGTVQTVSRESSLDADVIFLAVYFPDKLVTEFSFNSTVNYSGTTYDRMAWAYFLKKNMGLSIDSLIQTPAFGQGAEYFNLTLLDAYYNLYERSIIKPTKCKTEMVMPEKVYRGLDFTRPVIVNTPEFSWRFYISKMEGYQDSWTPFNVDLIRIV